MTQRVRISRNDGSMNSFRGPQQSTDLISGKNLWSRLRRGLEARTRFVESHLGKNLAFQIRILRDQAGWSQEELARRVGMNQNAISRLENPTYGKATLTTLKRIASAFDVALVVRFVSFGQLIDWVSGTSFLDKGLSSESLGVLNFARENIDKQQVPAVLGRVPNRTIARTQVLGLGPFQKSEAKSSAASELVPPKQTAA